MRFAPKQTHYRSSIKPSRTQAILPPASILASAPDERALVLELPQAIIYNIVFRLDTIEDVLAVYSSHPNIREKMRPWVFQKIFVKTPAQLDDVFAYLNNRKFSSNHQLMKGLSIKWEVIEHDKFAVPPKPKLVASLDDLNAFKNKVKTKQTLILALYGSKFESFVADYPGAFESVQEAGLRFHIPALHYKSLTRISIGNGGQPLFAGNQHAEFLFCALAATGEHTLEELTIDGGHYSQVNQSILLEDTFSSGIVNFRIPGQEMRRKFGFLDKLRQLTIRNLPGFTDPLLYWILSGNEFFRGATFATAKTAATRLLVLDNNPDITAMAVKIVLEGMGRGLGQLQIMLPHQIIEQDPVANFWEFWHLDNEACGEYFAKLDEYHQKMQMLRTIDGAEYIDLLEVIGRHCPFATESGIVVGKALDCAVLRPDDVNEICSCPTPHLRPRSSSVSSAYSSSTSRFHCRSSSSCRTSISGRSAPIYVKGMPRPEIPWTPKFEIEEYPPVPEIPAIFKRESSSSTVETVTHVEEVKSDKIDETTSTASIKSAAFTEGVKKLVSGIKMTKLAFWK